MALIEQLTHKYEDEHIELAIDTIFKIFKTASTMSEEDADSYLTTCLGVYILDSFSGHPDDGVITNIKPRK